VWTGSQALERKLVDQIGGLREALADARELGGLTKDAPIVELPEEDDSLLGMLLGLAGVSAAGAQVAAGALVPPAMMDLARVLSPFMIFTVRLTMTVRVKTSRSIICATLPTRRWRARQ
jgi:protease-4